MKQLSLTISLLMLFLTGCAPASMPSPTAVVLVTPTHSPSPTFTLTPTPIPPTPTFTPSPTLTPTPTPTPSPTPIPTETPTPTPIPTFTLSGVVFFDYNSNGVHDSHEPPIPGATVQVGSLVAESGEDGSYAIEGMPAGKRQVKLAAPENFRYISLSLEAFQTIEEPVSIVVNGNLRRDWGLMEGFLTLPFDSNIAVEIRGFYDHMSDELPGVVNYMGDTIEITDPTQYIGTEKTHHGIDFGAPGGSWSFRGTPVRASAPGTLNSTSGSWDGALCVRINHGKDPYSNELFNTRYMELHTAYCHLDKYTPKIAEAIKNNDPVYIDRGEIIGYAGSTGTYDDLVVPGSGWPHLHFDTMYNERGGQDRFKKIDAFAVLSEVIQRYGDKLYDLEVAHVNWWTVYNDPQCVE